MRRKITVDATVVLRLAVLGSTLRRCTALSPVSSLFEWHHFVDLSAFFHQQLRRHRGIVTAKQSKKKKSKIESIYCFSFPKNALMVLCSAPLSQLVFNNEGCFCYRAGSITCKVTGMVASI
jgi:hypothetical protein